MDIDLMINSLPKLLSATVVTLKLLSLSLFFGLSAVYSLIILQSVQNPLFLTLLIR